MMTTKFEALARPVNQNQVETPNQPDYHQNEDHRLWWFKYQNKAAIEGLPPSFYEYLMLHPTQSRLSQLISIQKDTQFMAYLERIGSVAYCDGYNSDCAEEVPVRVAPPLLRRWKTKIHRALIERTVELSYVTGMLDV